MANNTNMSVRLERVETKIDRLEAKVDSLEAKVDSLGQKVDQLPTKADLAGFATKADLTGFATKADLAGFATKADLDAFAATIVTTMGIMLGDAKDSVQKAAEGYGATLERIERDLVDFRSDWKKKAEDTDRVLADHVGRLVILERVTGVSQE